MKVGTVSHPYDMRLIPAKLLTVNKCYQRPEQKKEIRSIISEFDYHLVNAVKVVKRDLIGYNTDVIGIESTLHSIASFTVDEPLGDSKSLVEKMSQKVTALILGTGGASKAVQYVLKKQGLPYHLVSRSAKRGDFTYKMLTPEIIRNHQLIINATPVGMAPHTKKAPSIPYEAITREHTLFDLIYNPEETLFLRYGREHGAQTINGLTMLHAQAQATWEIWSSLR